MSIALAPRSRVVLHAGSNGSGMSAADRATLTRLLLERGLEGPCKHDPGSDRIDAAGVDPATLADNIQQASNQPAAGTAWKPWFPVIDYSRCTNCMQCLSFCLFDVYGVSTEQ